MSEWSCGPAWLFCPADRPDRYAKALERADIVILDLEDAVSPPDKSDARMALRRLVGDGSFQRERTVVRINSIRTPDGAIDIDLCAELRIDHLLLAKAEHAEEVQRIPAHVIALIESARGVAMVDSIAAASNLVGLMWGAEDLIADMSGTSSRKIDGTYQDVVQYARSRALIAAKAQRRLAIDAVHMDIPDLAGLRSECASAAAVGFDATAAIHPSQVDIIRSCYAPEDGRIIWAKRLLAHVGDRRSVTTFEGKMVDGPVYRQAERIIQLAKRGMT